MSGVAVGDRPAQRRLATSALIAVLGAVIANLIIGGLARAVVSAPHRFTPLQPPAFIALTIVGVLAAVGVYRVLIARVADPAHAFRRLVPIVLPLTYIPDALIWAVGAYGGAASARTVLPLMVMHLAAATVCWVVLPALRDQPGNAPVH